MRVKKYFSKKNEVKVRTRRKMRVNKDIFLEYNTIYEDIHNKNFLGSRRPVLIRQD